MPQPLHTGLGRVDSLDDSCPKKLAPDAIVVPVTSPRTASWRDVAKPWSEDFDADEIVARLPCLTAPCCTAGVKRAGLPVLRAIEQFISADAALVPYEPCRLSRQVAEATVNP
ncbi:unnamed protein product [Symbiodinium necroappetens]|uniref:Uncharacterized protein n=1 Tax=Symbiodinium necroappetens TaxID=1628268 RepID=A0A813ACF6_9DINO|nr:unnamed protein product [Symbiodinium necroappetens]